MTSIFEFFRYQLPAKFRGRFVSPVWDTGAQSHGVAVLAHADTWGLHGEQVEVHIEPIRPLTADELAVLPRVPSPVCPISAGNESLPGPYNARHFLFLPQQIEGATLGRCATIERYTGWLCVIGIGKVAIPSEDGRFLQGLIGGSG